MTRAFQRTIRRITKAPVRRLVSTHHHPDHTLGAVWFDKAQMIAHAACRREKERTPLNLAAFRKAVPKLANELQDIEQRLPDETFDGSLTLYLDDRPIELIHFGHAHSPGDVLVWVPDAGVLYAGDIAFNSVTPGGFDGNIGNWIRILRRLLTMDVSVVVPGHGTVGDRRALEDTLGYLQLLRRAAKKGFEAGAPARDVSEQIMLGGYADWAESWRVLPNVMKLYQEFAGDPTKPLDLQKALGS
jgi:cyclase